MGAPSIFLRCTAWLKACSRCASVSGSVCEPKKPPTSRTSLVSARKLIAAWLPALRLQKMKSLVSSRPSAAEALLSSSSSSTATAPPAASAASAGGGAASAAAASFLTCASASQAASYVERSALRREAEPASKGVPRRAPPLAAPALEAPGASTTPKRMGAPCWKREPM